MMLQCKMISITVAATATVFVSSYTLYRIFMKLKTRQPKVQSVPLQPRRIWYTKTPVSRTRISQLRTIFWNQKKTERNKETWAFLCGLCDIYNTDEAQNCLNNAKLVLPEGSLEKVYDRFGNYYDIPIYCISYPKNLLPNNSSIRQSRMNSISNLCDVQERGKPVYFRLRLPNRSKDMNWATYGYTKIEDIKEELENHFYLNKSKQKWFLSNGDELDDGTNLIDAKVNRDTVIHIKM